MCFLSSLTKLAHMLDLGHMAKLNVDTLSKKNYKKKTKGAANEQRMVTFIVNNPRLKSWACISESTL